MVQNGQDFEIRGATQIAVNTIEEALRLLMNGEGWSLLDPLNRIDNRHYASTMMNHASSRSHTIFRLYIQSMSVNMDSGTTEIAESILNFVDLAGSEKVDIHDGMRRKKNTMAGSF